MEVLKLRRRSSIWRGRGNGVASPRKGTSRPPLNIRPSPWN